MSDFHGAKLAILAGSRIVTILRDDIPGIPWPGHWDLPGGGREGAETPEACVLRETREELGLDIDPADLCHRSSMLRNGATIWFFVTEQGKFDQSRIQLGAEGQAWKLAPIDWYLRQPKAIPHHCRSLLTYLETRVSRG